MPAFLGRLAKALIILLVAGNTAFGQLGQYKDTTGEGKAMMEDLASRAPAQNSQMLGLLKIQRDDKRFEVPVSMNIITNENGSWKNVYQTQDVPGIPPQVLVIVHSTNGPNSYFYAVKTNLAAPSPPPLPVKREDIFKPFAGSDFWFADFGLEFYHWPQQQIIKKEMRKGRSCRVVESLNPDKKSTGYAKVLSWIDFETGGLIRAEAYDSLNNLVKEFSIQKMKKVQGVWQLKQMEILNNPTDSRTLLDFNLEVPE